MDTGLVLGSAAPDFTLRDQFGQDVTLSSFRGQKAVALFFYPFADFSPELAALVGYAQHRPNLGNYEGQCPSVLLEGEVVGPLAAIDALRPDQAEALGRYVAESGGV